jgi:ribulose-5-phosphate 4-epimerase/fuculose-1-phosphate aldolase
MNHSAEGVIKFDLEHTDAPALPVEETAELRAWFPILRQTGLVGQEANRYLGFAYGNISRRTTEGFIISCTQTSGKQALLPQDFSLVTGFDINANHLRSKGPCSPSSEAMTHGAVYSALPEVGAVFHAHSPVIWNHAQPLALPETAPDVEYGTPEMAEAVRQLLVKNPKTRLFSMGGHVDGIIAWGHTPEEAGLTLLKTLARAYQLNRD